MVHLGMPPGGGIPPGGGLPPRGGLPPQQGDRALGVKRLLGSGHGPNGKGRGLVFDSCSLGLLWDLALPLGSCVTLDKSPSLSEPQVAHL